MLSAGDRAILDFERSWRSEPGPKDRAIEFSLGLSSSAYYDLLRDLVSSRGAFEYDPLTVKRVCRVIEELADGEVAV